MAQLIYGITPYVWANNITTVKELRKYFFHKLKNWLPSQSFEKIVRTSFDEFLEEEYCHPYIKVTKPPKGKATFIPNPTYARDESPGLRINRRGIENTEEGIILDLNYHYYYKESTEQTYTIITEAENATRDHWWRNTENNEGTGTPGKSDWYTYLASMMQKPFKDTTK
uniref:CRAL-TRIO domain-containing protein n=1 Tax=Strongyloides papillosus TaxID=174720 RepID=A0A0N5BYS4_STREA